MIYLGDGAFCETHKYIHGDEFMPIALYQTRLPLEPGLVSAFSFYSNPPFLTLYTIFSIYIQHVRPPGNSCPDGDWF